MSLLFFDQDAEHLRGIFKKSKIGTKKKMTCGEFFQYNPFPESVYFRPDPYFYRCIQNSTIGYLCLIGQFW